MSTIRQSYYAVIPANVRYDTSLPDGAKLLYGEITSLSDKEGFCWATNAYFADLYSASNRTISRWLTALSQAGHIAYIVDNAAGNSRKIWLAQHVISAMKKVADPHDKNVSRVATKMSRGSRQKCLEGRDKNVVTQVKELNTKLNTTLNTTTMSLPPKKKRPKMVEKNAPPSPAPPPPSAFDLVAEAAALTGDPFALEQFQRAGGLADEFPATVEEFILHIRAETGSDATPNYPNRREFRKHFFNWVRRRKEAGKRSANGGPISPPRPNSRAKINRWENNRPALTEKQSF